MLVFLKEIVNPDAKDEWKTLQSQIRLVHVNTSQAVKVRLFYDIYDITSLYNTCKVFFIILII